MRTRIYLVLICIILSSCSFGRPSTPAVEPVLTNTPVIPTEAMPTVAPSATPIPEPTATAIPAVTAIHVRILAADAKSYAPMQRIIEAAAAEVGLDIVVDIRSPEGTMALQQGLLANDSVDLWVANSLDVWQLDRRGAISDSPITTDIPAYDFGLQGLSLYPNKGVAPLAAQNYLISIYNTEILSSAPATINQLEVMPGLLMRPRYRMAYPWAEGRWFDALMQQYDATAVLTDGVQSINPQAATVAIQTLVDLRDLGPRDVTSYIESTTDFLNSRVPYTLDGDAALRRYATISDTLLLDYALPPIVDASDALWLPDIDVVYAVVPAVIESERRTQVLALIAQLQRRPVQLELFRQMRWIPVRSDILPVIADDTLAPVLNQVGLMTRAQVYTDAVICRWDSYEQVLPYALLNLWRMSAVVDSLDDLLADCPPES